MPYWSCLLRELTTALMTPASRSQEGDMPPPQPPAQAVESKALDPYMESALAYGSGPRRGKATIPLEKALWSGDSVLWWERGRGDQGWAIGQSVPTPKFIGFLGLFAVTSGTCLLLPPHSYLAASCPELLGELQACVDQQGR